MPATCRSIGNTSVTGSLLKISHNRIVALQLDLVKVIRWCWGQKIFWFLWYTDCFAFHALAILKHLKFVHFLRKKATFRCLRVKISHAFFMQAWNAWPFGPCIIVYVMYDKSTRTKTKTEEKRMLIYSSGAGYGRLFIHIGPTLVRDVMEEKQELCALYGERSRHTCLFIESCEVHFMKPYGIAKK